MSTISTENINLTVRDPESYSEELKFVLDLITFNETPKVVGSYAFTSHKYPSDVDVFESVSIDLNREDAVKFYESQFRIIFAKLSINANKIFINDFKCGEDPSLKQIYLFGNVTLNNDKIKNSLRNLLDMNKFLDLYSIKNDIIFRDKLLKLAALRWTPQEVLSGMKRLVTGDYIKLSEALMQPAIVKLDVISWIRDRFQSIEVLYNLNYKKESGQYDTSASVSRKLSIHKALNDNRYASFYPLGDYTQSLLNDINKFSTAEFYSPLKVAKRTWILSRIEGCDDLLEILNPLMSSDSAALNQVKSEIDILVDIINMKQDKFSTGNFDVMRITDALELNKIINNLFTQLLNFSKRLSNHLPDDSYDSLKNSFTEFYLQWLNYSQHGKFNSNIVINNLSEIKIVISKEINKESGKYLSHIQKLNIQCKIN